MGLKRDHDALNYFDNDEPAPYPSNKRQRNQAPSKGKQNAHQPTTDPTYGQRFMFPGLDGSTALSDDDLEYEDDGDALAYLRTVRLEASGIPHLLVAPKAGPQLPPELASTSLDESESIDRNLYNSGVGDSRGYYQDGAYTAAPDTDISDEEGYNYDDGDQDAESNLAGRNRLLREAYYKSLVSQFTALRDQLRRDPPPSVVDSLPPNHETDVGTFGPNSPTFRMWTSRLRYTDPLPAQVAAMDKESALKLLRIILGGKFLRRGHELRERTSRWIWSLLARLPDRGEMDYMEIGWVRELGKRAVLMLISIAQMVALREEVEDDLDEEGNDEGERDEGDSLDDLVSEEEEGEAPSGRQASLPPQLPESVDDSHGAAKPEARNPDAEDDDGEMDMDIEEGEVSDSQADIEAAKARLLARLDETASETNHESEPTPVVEGEGEGEDDQEEGEWEEEDEEDAQAYSERRSRINMRATLNMILTVAGEFYGQRDLLEFRDPFASL